MNVCSTRCYQHQASNGVLIKNEFCENRSHNRRNSSSIVHWTRLTSHKKTTPSSLFAPILLIVYCPGRLDGTSLLNAIRTINDGTGSVHFFYHPSRLFWYSDSIRIIWADSICKLKSIYVYIWRKCYDFIHSSCTSFHLNSPRNNKKERRNSEEAENKRWKSFFFISFILSLHCLIFARNLIWSAHISSPLLFHPTKILIECTAAGCKKKAKIARARERPNIRSADHISIEH